MHVIFWRLLWSFSLLQKHGDGDMPLNDWVIFFQNVILFSNLVHHKCYIFYMKLVQYNECLISIVDADGLVL